MVKCKDCPWCKDTYPDKLDYHGNHYYICGMTGNMVYKEPRKERRYSGKGYIRYGYGSCGLWDSAEDVLEHMTEPEIRRAENNKA